MQSQEGQQLLAGHRAYITVLFCDLRGFTAFAQTAEPEELMDVLREYHATVGQLIASHGGTLERFAGDGLMIFFNDPQPLADHETQAVKAALDIRDRFAGLSDGWRRRDIDLGLGIGIAAGYATLGRIGFEGRYDYAAIGTVVNLASRLCSAAKAGQILISQRLFGTVEGLVDAEPVDDLELKGFGRQVRAYEVLGGR